MNHKNNFQISKMSRHLKHLSVIVFSLILGSCTNQDTTTPASIDSSISKIEVLDFHSTHRCMTCNAIEANTKYTLNTYFSNELKDDKITFKVINIDEEENESIAEKFEASGTSLILNVINKGKETQINLTDFAFMKGNDKEAFSTELKAKIDSELKNL